MKIHDWLQIMIYRTRENWSKIALVHVLPHQPLEEPTAPNFARVWFYPNRQLSLCVQKFWDSWLVNRQVRYVVWTPLFSKASPMPRRFGNRLASIADEPTGQFPIIKSLRPFRRAIRIQKWNNVAHRLPLSFRRWILRVAIVRMRLWRPIRQDELSGYYSVFCTKKKH